MREEGLNAGRVTAAGGAGYSCVAEVTLVVDLRERGGGGEEVIDD